MFVTTHWCYVESPPLLESLELKPLSKSVTSSQKIFCKQGALSHVADAFSWFPIGTSTV